MINCIYRLADSCVASFIERNSERLEAYQNKNKIICGDYNNNLENLNEQKKHLTF